MKFAFFLLFAIAIISKTFFHRLFALFHFFQLFFRGVRFVIHYY